MPSRLLVLSNGHGEDLIALRVLEALRRRRPELELRVLPLVGEGAAFAAAEAAGGLQRLGPRQSLPSGGFSNQSLRGLGRDLAAGLPLLSWRQARLVRRWGQSGLPILAVGDLLPLLLAWAGGGAYGFLGTPKSDHTWASAAPEGWGAHPLADGYHRLKGSEWDPWEWALMRCRRCRLVAVRDPLTAAGLQRQGVAATAPGNPMMDGLDEEEPPAWLAGRRRLLLLPGSRDPEALANLERLLACLGRSGSAGGPAVASTSRAEIAALLATGGTPSPERLAALLERTGFRPVPAPPGSGAASAWQREALLLLHGPGCFARWAGWSELGLATAGTATEQLVGLGIPALSLPGPGPQFKPGFALRQSRLLGGAVHPCHSSDELNSRLMQLLHDPAERLRLGRIGRERMGPAGGSARLAEAIEAQLLS